MVHFQGTSYRSHTVCAFPFIGIFFSSKNSAFNTIVVRHLSCGASRKILRLVPYRKLTHTTHRAASAKTKSTRASSTRRRNPRASNRKTTTTHSRTTTPRPSFHTMPMSKMSQTPTSSPLSMLHLELRAHHLPPDRWGMKNVRPFQT